jgi:hypothetical protein
MARGGSKIGSTKVPLPDRVHFTTAAEIASRDDQTKRLQPTEFKQIGVGDNPGMDRASKQMARKTGDLKFGHLG